MLFANSRKKIWKIVTLLFCITFSISIYAQEDLDSLTQSLFENYEDVKYTEQNLEILDKIYQLSYSGQPTQPLEACALAINLTKNTDDSLSSKAIWLTKMGDIHYENKNFSFAMKSYSAAYEIFEKLQDKKNTAYSLIDIGNTLVSQPEYALKYYNRADKILSAIQDTIGLITVKYKTGYVKYLKDDIDTAFIILYDAKKLSNKYSDLKLIAETNYFMALTFTEDQEPDSAVKYYNLALENFNNNSDNYNTGKIYYALGEIYFEEENYENSKSAYQNSLEIFSTLKSDKWITNIYNNLGRIYFIEGENKTADEFAQKSLEKSEIYFDEFNIQKRDAYLLLSEIYESRKNVNKAYEYLTLYKVTNNLVHESEIEKQQTQLQAYLETENIEKEIEILKKEDALKEQRLQAKQIQTYGFLAVIVLVLAFAIYYFYSSRKEKRVNNLLIAQNEEINLQKKEIESQSRILEKANRAILKQKEEIENKTIKITHSINYASRIQFAMLSNIHVLQGNFIDHFVFFKPKEAVSGDFYWFSVVKEDSAPSLFRKKTVLDETSKIVVAVVDCTGHGVPGAFMSMLGDAYLNQIINLQKILEPEKILMELHKAIRSTLQQQETDNNDGMDIALCVIDKTKRTMEFSGAKNPLIYIQSGKMERINGDLMSIGGLQKERVRHFNKYTIDITTETTVYLFSDGYQDQFGGKYGRKFMAKPFRDILFDNHTKTFEEQKNLLSSTLKKWQGKYTQMDDITVVGFKI
jgi:serine phosphatase RsbU (regulator of sigma subunit)